MKVAVFHAGPPLLRALSPVPEGERSASQDGYLPGESTPPPRGPGERVARAALGLVLAPALGMGAGLLGAVGTSKALSAVASKTFGLDTLMRTAEGLSPQLMVMGTAVGLAGALALAGAERSGPPSGLKSSLTMGGVILAGLGAGGATGLLTGDLVLTVAAGVAGATLGGQTGYALGDALPRWLANCQRLS
jgi:hypothetical protein